MQVVEAASGEGDGAEASTPLTASSSSTKVHPAPPNSTVSSKRLGRERKRPQPKRSQQLPTKPLLQDAVGSHSRKRTSKCNLIPCSLVIGRRRYAETDRQRRERHKSAQPCHGISACTVGSMLQWLVLSSLLCMWYQQCGVIFLFVKVA